jgi:hypothetical protein
MITEKVECVECGREIRPGEDESTYCGSVHAGECLESHKRHCRQCDEDGEYHGDAD